MEVRREGEWQDVKTMICPYWSKERGLVNYCTCATIRFHTKEDRRVWVYPYCASIDGWKHCPFVKLRESKY